ncbi:hypothetical protein CBW56_04665 [Denitratisoma oestradiolicum]|nr:hypothetical protein CBW56_04665 [Denitratisoma oestradiolicum]
MNGGRPMNIQHKHFAARIIPTLIASALAGTTMTALAEKGAVLEEVIVTAQKRAERLQDVPLSISAISGGQLEARGIEGGADISGLAPNVVVNRSPANDLISQISIRGASTGQPSILVDPSVGMYIDGVYVAKSLGNLSEMVDLERIEVLRGPQGTLFGRNTLGGAINFISRKPAGVFSGSANLEIGNFGHHVERLSIDLPKMGITSLSFALRNEMQDGWLKNDNGRAFSDKDRQAFRLAANFDISRDFQVDYKYDHTESDSMPTAATLYAANGSGTILYGGLDLEALGYVGTASRASTSRPKSFAADPGGTFYQKLKVDGHALTATYQLDPSNTVKYIGSYRKLFYSDQMDLDGTPLPIVVTGQDTDLRTWSHEFQWVGNTDRFNYVAGYYIFKEDGFTYDMRGIYGDNGFVNSGVTTKQKAIYGQLDWKATPNLTLTAGIRRTREDRGLQASQYGTVGYQGPVFETRVAPVEYMTGFSATTPTLSAIYKLSDTVNIYARMAKGFKSGGWNGEATNPITLSTPYQPEKSQTLEFGVKSNFAEGRGMFNATYFHNKITDMQLTMIPPGSVQSNLYNAGKATQQGIELELTWQMSDGWRLTSSYGYLDAKFDEYLDAGINPPNAGVVINTASNREMPYAPKHTLNLAIDGRLAKTDWGTLRLIADYTWLSERFLYAVNKSYDSPLAASGAVASMTEISAIGLLNTRLLLANIPVGGPGAAEASFWVKNLTDEKKSMNGIDFYFYRTATWAPPRTYGVSFGYKW